MKKLYRWVCVLVVENVLWIVEPLVVVVPLLAISIALIWYGSCSALIFFNLLVINIKNINTNVKKTTRADTTPYHMAVGAVLGIVLGIFLVLVVLGIVVVVVTCDITKCQRSFEY